MSVKRTMPTIELETFQIPCRVFGCHNKAKYRIGNMKGSPILFYHLCDECFKSIIDSIPEELLPTKVVEAESITSHKEREELTKRFINHMEEGELSYKEMQQTLKEAGLKATGNKEEITERYEKYIRGELDG